MEPRRLLTTLSGTVFDDANHDGVRQSGETGLGGRRLFADYNYNGAFDAGEPFASSSVDGAYTITTRSTNVSLRLHPADGTVSLPYGATSRWYANLTQDLTGQNFGVDVTRKIRLDLFADTNANALHDTAERSLPYADSSLTAWIDLDGNATFNYLAGERSFSYQPDPSGTNVLTLDVTPGTYRVRVKASDGALFTSGNVYQVTVPVSGDTATVVPVGIKNAAFVDVRLFNDRNANGQLDADESVYAPGAAFFGNHNLFFDANGDSVFQENERYIVGYSTIDNAVHPVWMTAGSFTLAGLGRGERVTTANPIVVASGSNATQVLAIGIAGAAEKSVSVGVYLDTNANGLQDANEFEIAGQTVFADYDLDGQLDADEPYAVSSYNAYLNVRHQAFALRLLPSPGYATSGPSSITFTPSGDDFTRSGNSMGVKSVAPVSQVTFNFFPDYNANGTRDANETGSLRIDEFRGWLDLDGNDTQNVAAGEISITLQIDEYTGGGTSALHYVNLPDGNYRFQVRTRDAVMTTGNVLSVTVNGANVTKAVGISGLAPVDISVFHDLNGNGIQESGESVAGGLDVWWSDRLVFLDANNNGLYDEGEATVGSNHYGDVWPTQLKLGTYTVVGLKSGERFTTPHVITIGPGSTTFAIGIADSALSVTPKVYNDLNRNGRFDAGEPGVAGQAVFVDYDYDGIQDSGEPLGYTDSNGSIVLAVDNRAFALRVVPTSPYATSGTAVQYFVPDGTGGLRSSGNSFGVAASAADGQINLTYFADYNLNGVKDATDALLPPERGLGAFLDSNRNGAFDTGETLGQLITDKYGSYVIRFDRLTPGQSYRVVTAVTLPSGEYIYQGAAKDIVAQSNPTNFTPGPVTPIAIGGYAKSRVAVHTFDDTNRNGREDASETSSEYIAFVDLDFDGVLDAGELSDNYTGTSFIDFELPPGQYAIRILDWNTQTLRTLAYGATSIWVDARTPRYYTLTAAVQPK